MSDKWQAAKVARKAKRAADPEVAARRLKHAQEQAKRERESGGPAAGALAKWVVNRD